VCAQTAHKQEPFRVGRWVRSLLWSVGVTRLGPCQACNYCQLQDQAADSLPKCLATLWHVSTQWPVTHMTRADMWPKDNKQAPHVD
jgi:hypothetical protein